MPCHRAVRYLFMIGNKCLHAVHHRAGGRFVDADLVLLALFADPACRNSGRWPEVFGKVGAAPPREPPGAFIARALRAQIARLPPED